MNSKERSQAIVDTQKVLRNQLLDAYATLNEIQALLEDDFRAHGWDNRAIAAELRGGLGLLYRGLSADKERWQGYNRARQEE